MLTVGFVFRRPRKSARAPSPCRAVFTCHCSYPPGPGDARGKNPPGGRPGALAPPTAPRGGAALPAPDPPPLRTGQDGVYAVCFLPGSLILASGGGCSRFDGDAQWWVRVHMRCLIFLCLMFDVCNMCLLAPSFPQLRCWGFRVRGVYPANLTMGPWGGAGGGGRLHPSASIPPCPRVPPGHRRSPAPYPGTPLGGPFRMQRKAFTFRGSIGFGPLSSPIWATKLRQHPKTLPARK